MLTPIKTKFQPSPGRRVHRDGALQVQRERRRLLGCGDRLVRGFRRDVQVGAGERDARGTVLSAGFRQKGKLFH